MAAARCWKDFWRAAFSTKYLVITNTVSCVSLLSAADIAQQLFAGASFWASFPPHVYYDHYDYEHKCYREREKSLDEEDEIRRINWRRTRRVASIGLITGPMNTYWYRFLESVIKGPISPATIAMKVTADIASTPAFDSTYIIGVATQEGKSIEEAIAEYKLKFWTILRTSASVWTPAQTLNFWLVPQRFRVVYVALVTFFYNSLLNYIKHDNAPHLTTLRSWSAADEETRIKEARALTVPQPPRVPLLRLSSSNEIFKPQTGEFMLAGIETSTDGDSLDDDTVIEASTSSDVRRTDESVNAAR